jgi:hypothetical protein
MDYGHHGHLVQLFVVLVSNNGIVRVFHRVQVVEIILSNRERVVKQIVNVSLVTFIWLIKLKKILIVFRS